jgi:hypothetical protein
MDHTLWNFAGSIQCQINWYSYSCLTLTFIWKWQAWNICCGGAGSWHVVMISLRGYMGFVILASRHWHSNATFGKWVICLSRGFVSCKWSHEFPCLAHIQFKFYTCTRLLIIISSFVLNNYCSVWRIIIKNTMQ